MINSKKITKILNRCLFYYNYCFMINYYSKSLIGLETAFDPEIGYNVAHIGLQKKHT